MCSARRKKKGEEIKGTRTFFSTKLTPLIIAWRMPRRARIAPGGVVYHTLNRANDPNELFSKPEGYAAFERIMVAATGPKIGSVG
jgi:hypothetical protein